MRITTRNLDETDMRVILQHIRIVVVRQIRVQHIFIVSHPHLFCLVFRITLSIVVVVIIIVAVCTHTIDLLCRIHCNLCHGTRNIHLMILDIVSRLDDLQLFWCGQKIHSAVANAEFTIAIRAPRVQTSIIADGNRVVEARLDALNGNVVSVKIFDECGRCQTMLMTVSEFSVMVVTPREHLTNVVENGHKIMTACHMTQHTLVRHARNYSLRRTTRQLLQQQHLGQLFPLLFRHGRGLGVGVGVCFLAHLMLFFLVFMFLCCFSRSRKQFSRFHPFRCNLLHSTLNFLFFAQFMLGSRLFRLRIILLFFRHFIFDRQYPSLILFCCVMLLLLAFVVVVVVVVIVSRRF
mmetsp:Transcript_22188/g.35606  ORF Transcript_22188/g.35606 Transcript_22188/m.35606 type:complete len:349 (-) Transcript_22188:244-1290(-)